MNNTHITTPKLRYQQWFPQYQETPPPPPTPPLPLFYYALFFFNCHVTQSHNVNQILRKQLYRWLSADCITQNVSNHIHTFQATFIFHPDSSRWGFQQLWRAISWRRRFGEPITWLRVVGGPIREKKETQFQQYPDSSLCGLGVKEMTDELCSLQWWCLWKKRELAKVAASVLTYKWT